MNGASFLAGAEKEGGSSKGTVAEVQGGTFPMFPVKQTSGVMLP